MIHGKKHESGKAGIRGQQLLWATPSPQVVEPPGGKTRNQVGKSRGGGRWGTSPNFLAIKMGNIFNGLPWPCSYTSAQAFNLLSVRERRVLEEGKNTHGRQKYPGRTVTTQGILCHLKGCNIVSKE